jgi:hypothetical protein
MALHAIMYRPVSSASVAEDIMYCLVGQLYCLKGRSAHPLGFVVLACSNSLCRCVLLAPCCLRGRRVQHFLVWPGNQGAVVFVALCLQLVWMTLKLWP